jgi:hypothetical protein
MFHTYIDVTNDGRIFYVGMGNDNRLNRRAARNKRHGHVAKKHGLRREVALSSENRQDAIDHEIKLIAEYHTFVDDPLYNGIGCNYTRGGEGCPCSEETKRKMSEDRRGKPTWNKGKHGLKYNFSEETRQKARDQLIAFNQTRPMLGKHHSEDAKTRMRKPHICSICKVTGHTKTTCPKRPADAVNVVSLAQIRRRARQ